MFDWLSDLAYFLSQWWAYLLGLGVPTVLTLILGFARFWVGWKANHGRRIRITYRIREDWIGKVHPFHLPLQISVANHTGATVYREYVYIKTRDGHRIPPQGINPPSQEPDRPLDNGKSIVVTYEILYLSEQLLIRGYRGAALVKFVFATPQKDHTKWLWIRNLERWAKDGIVTDVTEQDRREGRIHWLPRWFGRRTSA